jgi:hypothetical protein
VENLGANGFIDSIWDSGRLRFDGPEPTPLIRAPFVAGRVAISVVAIGALLSRGEENGGYRDA